MEINLEEGDSDVAVCYRLGGYAGFTGSLSGWTLWDTAAALPANAADTPTPWDVADQGFAAGQTYGIYVITTDGKTISYSNGVTEGAVPAGDAGLTIFTGVGVAYPFASIFNTRNWNGTIICSAAADAPLPAALPPALVGVGAPAAIGRRRRA